MEPLCFIPIKSVRRKSLPLQLFEAKGLFCEILFVNLDLPTLFVHVDQIDVFEEIFLSIGILFHYSNLLNSPYSTPGI